jgi:hypothetical protein
LTGVRPSGAAPGNMLTDLAVGLGSVGAAVAVENIRLGQGLDEDNLPVERAMSVITRSPMIPWAR